MSVSLFSALTVTLGTLTNLPLFYEQEVVKAFRELGHKSSVSSFCASHAEARNRVKRQASAWRQRTLDAGEGFNARVIALAGMHAHSDHIFTAANICCNPVFVPAPKPIIARVRLQCRWVAKRGCPRPAPFYEQEVVKAAYKASINFFRISLLERMAGSRAGEAWRSEPSTLGRGDMLAYVGERAVLRSPISPCVTH
jgi:hypothetical protein